ncbi:DUF1549 domain-containing protein [bacterium]|nr:DUF1549 domain-containing protein [bacterium]
MELEIFSAYLGRFHPAIVHFPISCIVFACLAELLSWYYGGTFQPIKCSRARERSEKWRSFSRLLLATGLLSTVIAALLGFLNASDQTFGGGASETLAAHQFFALITLALLLVTCFFAVRADRRQERYSLLFMRGALLCTGGVLLYASHQGGLLVHGSDYFSEVLARSRPPQPLAQPRAEYSRAQLARLPHPNSGTVRFREDIAPIFEQRCARCHMNGKRKGGFQMNSRADLLRGGKEGPAVVLGRSEESALIHLVAGLEPDRLMPEKGELLTDLEIGMLRRWIDDGMPWDEEEGSVAAPQTVSRRKGAEEMLSPVRPPSCVPCQEKSNAIDRFLAFSETKNNVSSESLVSESRFVRRLYLDILGRLPTRLEQREAVARVSRGEEQELVAQLFSRHEEYAMAWLPFWNDLLRNDYTGPGFSQKNPKRRRKTITNFLLESLRENMPYDLLVRKLIAPDRHSVGFIRGILWPGDVGPNERPEMQAAQNVGQVFLGINLKCASCHDSFTSSWKLKDSYALASVFAEEPLEIFECGKSHGEKAAPRFLFPELNTVRDGARRKQRLVQLGRDLTDPENGRFAKNFVNRIWAKLFGRGFVEPLDEMVGLGWDEDLFRWLATSFVQHGYDIQWLLTQIVTSEAYRRESQPASEQIFEPSLSYRFEGPVYRPLPAEAVFDSLAALFRVGGPYTEGDLKRNLPYVTRTVRAKPGEEVRYLLAPHRDLLVSFAPYSKRGRKKVLKKESSVAFSGARLRSALREYYSFSEEGALLLSSEQETEEQLVFFGLGTVRFAPQVGDDPREVTLRVQGSVPLEILFFENLPSHAALREHTPLLASFGRPHRTQVTSRRDTRFSSPKILEIATHPHWDSLVRFIAAELARRETPLADIEQLLGRSISPEERKLFLEQLRKGGEHLIWSLLVSPEFLLIQ